MSRLSGRVAIITGASSGLGRAIALEYAREGASIVCADLQPTASSHSSEDIPAATHELIIQEGGNAIFVKTDVTHEDDIQAVVSEAVGSFGRLDIMVNNAGIGNVERMMKQAGGFRLHETPTEEFDTTYKINTRGVFLGCKHAIGQFLRQEPHAINSRGDATRGWIVNTASTAGLIALRGAPSYTASKHAVLGLTKQVAIDYAKDRIHCNALCPSFIETPLIAPITQSDSPIAVGTKIALENAHPWGGLGHTDDVVKAAVFLVSDAAQWITGHSLVIDGGYTCQ